jgi:invasion protein IalB
MPSMSRMLSSLSKLLIVSVFAACTQTPVNAQDAGDAGVGKRVANGARFGAWTVSCEAVAVNETTCVLSQRLVRSSDNAFLAEILAFMNADGSRKFLAARVPNGVHFPSGFALKPKESESRIEFVWQSCTRETCEALVEMSADKLAELSKFEEIVAGYRPGIQTKPLVFRMSMAGVQEGLAALQASTIKPEEKVGAGTDNGPKN